MAKKAEMQKSGGTKLKITFHNIVLTLNAYLQRTIMSMVAIVINQTVKLCDLICEKLKNQI